MGLRPYPLAPQGGRPRAAGLSPFRRGCWVWGGEWCGG